MRAAVVAVLVALPCQTKIVALPTRGSTGGEHSAVGHQHAVIAKRRVTGQRGRSKDVAGGPGRCVAPLSVHFGFPIILHGPVCSVPALEERLGGAWLPAGDVCTLPTPLHPLPVPQSSRSGWPALCGAARKCFDTAAAACFLLPLCSSASPAPSCSRLTVLCAHP